MSTTNSDNNYNIITRKIRLSIDYPADKKSEIHNAYNKLYDWQNIAYRACNMIASHLYFQEQQKDFFYFSDDYLSKLADQEKNPDGILKTSRHNTCYQVIANKYANILPASIASCLNNLVYKCFIKEKQDYFLGKKSLRNYKEGMPVPFPPKAFFDFRYDKEIDNFRFLLFKSDKYRLPFKTYLGRDASNNRVILNRILTKEYNIQNSSISIENNKIYLYLTLKIPKTKVVVDPNNKITAKLSFYAPVVASFNNKEFRIGDKESYLYKRIAIQEGRKRRQYKLKYNNGGRGRNHKLKNLEEFKKKEYNFINTQMHKISKLLVDLCIEKEAGQLILNDIIQSKEEAKEYPFVIRNWSFGSLKEKLAYKCSLNNIKLVIN